MSLKGFHIVFASSVAALCLFVCGWAYYHYTTASSVDYLFIFATAAMAAVTSIIYGILFYKKVNIQ